MLWRIALLGLVIAGFAHDAAANGRAPATVSIRFRQGHDTDVLAGMTFGMVVSHDGGATWNWMCEDAIGYKGTYDPRYAYSTSGAIFATTFSGLKVNRDACTFEATPSQQTFISTVTLGPDHAVFYAAAQGPAGNDPGDSDIYRSDDDGKTTAAMAMPGMINDWWESLLVAPSDPKRVYLSGYRFVPNPDGDAGTHKVHLLFKSIDGGKTWTELSVSAFTLVENSVIHVVGVSPTNPDHVYVHVELDTPVGDSIWRSTNGGDAWTRIVMKNTSPLSFVARANGDIIVGTQAIGAEVSHDEGANWTPLTNPPHISCLVENAAGEVWACTQNYGIPGVPSDNAGIMKSTDLATWTPVLRYQDLKAPVACAAGTVQNQTCSAMWCAFCAQIGCVPDASFSCTAADVTVPKKSGGCCDAGDGGTSALALGVLVGMVVLRRPRSRR